MKIIKIKAQRRRSSTHRKHSANLQKSIQQNSSFYNNDPIQTPEILNLECSFLFSMTKQSLKTEVKIKEQKVCANKLCKNYTRFTEGEIMQISIQTLCHLCQQQFKNDSFCLYCKQVYFDQTDDGKQWIMCEQCQKWVHTFCADFNTKDYHSAVFKCIKCQKVPSQPNQRKNKTRNGIPKVQKKKTYEFIDTIGFQWQLTPNQIADDIEKIKKYLDSN